MINENLKNLKENYKEYNDEDLHQILTDLQKDFKKTKDLIINLSYNLDEIEEVYNKIYDEVKNREDGRTADKTNN